VSKQGRADLRSAYLYLVCLVALVMSLVAAVNMVRNTAELVYPNPGIYAFEPPYAPDGEQSDFDPQERERREQAARDAQRRSAVLGLVGSGTMLLLAGPLYLYHWRRVQSELGPVRGRDGDPDTPSRE
jgi:hypothetical protein